MSALMIPPFASFHARGVRAFGVPGSVAEYLRDYY
jgi:hypothetical protein